MVLAGFEVVPATVGPLSWTGAQWKLVLHTTEGTSAEGAIGAYRAALSWPHFTVDCQRRRKIQHLELISAARSLLHPTGTVETNRANAVQIELVGFASDTPNWAKVDLQWFATDVLAPIRAVCPFGLVAARFVAYPASAGTGASQRFTDVDWINFSGICGHEHVPHNDHGDPGLIDTTTILAALGTPPQPTPHRRQPGMYVVQLESNKGTANYHVWTGPGQWMQRNTFKAALEVCGMIGQVGQIPTIPDDLYHDLGGR